MDINKTSLFPKRSNDCDDILIVLSRPTEELYETDFDISDGDEDDNLKPR